MDHQQVEAFINQGFGWITPEGIVHACDLHDHFVSMEQFPEFAEALERYRTIADDNNRMMQEDLDALGPDEHPAMHRFAFMNDDAAGEFIKTIYTMGWVRLGVAMDTQWIRSLRTDKGIAHALRGIDRKDYQQILEAEGLAPAVDHLAKPLQSLARGVGARLVTRRMEYVVETYGRYGRQSREYLTVAK